MVIPKIMTFNKKYAKQELGSHGVPGCLPTDRKRSDPMRVALQSSHKSAAETRVDYRRFFFAAVTDPSGSAVGGRRWMIARLRDKALQNMAGHAPWPVLLRRKRLRQAPPRAGGSIPLRCACADDFDIRIKRAVPTI